MGTENSIPCRETAVKIVRAKVRARVQGAERTAKAHERRNSEKGVSLLIHLLTRQVHPFYPFRTAQQWQGDLFLLILLGLRPRSSRSSSLTATSANSTARLTVMNLVVCAMLDGQITSKLLPAKPRGAPNAPKTRFEKLHDLPVNSLKWATYARCSYWVTAKSVCLRGRGLIPSKWHRKWFLESSRTVRP